MTKIQTIKVREELPTWFDFEHYKGFQYLTRYDYIEQILVRIQLYNEVTDGDELFFPISEAWESITSSSPIVTTSIRQEFVTNQINVRSLTISDALHISSSYETLDDTDGDFDIEATQYLYESTGFNGEILVIENTTAPIDVLLGQIRSHLELRCSNNKKVPQFSKQLSSMYLKRCHIYLDLLIWSLQERLVRGNTHTIKISQKLLYQTIFPDMTYKYLESEKQLERTTISLTRDILSKPTSHLTQMQHHLFTKPEVAQQLVSSKV
ncbi:DUF6387 family protein [Vibrio algarum]|uniref:DUF6387 family protein n=1 Tax=Vibrio algarum TaxID=3020714 RepID=A0ABT4YU25_9VIBR|nr:DUF6387 family protein [Vibrio sp. KJ40-1]MDB1124671.1 DUF6387 family protein [Vibrio sp. KJ40-1]